MSNPEELEDLIGHNNPPAEAEETETETIKGGVAGEQLRSFVERIERLEEEKRAIADDIKDVKAEAKSCGFDTKVLTQVLRIRRMDADQRREEEALLDTYLHALGML